MLSNKIIVVTGAGSGIGRATCLVLAKAGAKVLVTSHSEANAWGNRGHGRKGRRRGEGAEGRREQ